MPQKSHLLLQLSLFLLCFVVQLSSQDHTGEELAQSGMNIMCRMCFLGEGEGSERARRMISCKNCGKKYHKNCIKSWAQHRGTCIQFVALHFVLACQRLIRLIAVSCRFISLEFMVLSLVPGL